MHRSECNKPDWKSNSADKGNTTMNYVGKQMSNLNELWQSKITLSNSMANLKTSTKNHVESDNHLNVKCS